TRNRRRVPCALHNHQLQLQQHLTKPEESLSGVAHASKSLNSIGQTG
nr:hypothetical protein [Tanacetum cinerariifolium]